MRLSNEQYDFWKEIALIVLPAIAAFYASLASLWGLPYPEEIVGTISALDVFLGAILKVSTINYRNDGGGEVYG